MFLQPPVRLHNAVLDAELAHELRERQVEVVGPEEEQLVRQVRPLLHECSEGADQHRDVAPLRQLADEDDVRAVLAELLDPRLAQDRFVVDRAERLVGALRNDVDPTRVDPVGGLDVVLDRLGRHDHAIGLAGARAVEVRVRHRIPPRMRPLLHLVDAMCHHHCAAAVRERKRVARAKENVNIFDRRREPDVLPQQTRELRAKDTGRNGPFGTRSDARGSRTYSVALSCSASIPAQ